MKALIFDMDGVLVDVSESYRIAIQQTAELFLKREVAPEEIQGLKNAGGFNNDWNLTEALIKKNGMGVDKKKVIKVFQKYYLGDDFNGLIKNEKWLLDLGVLERLRSKYRLGILTGRPKKEALYALERFETKDFFDAVVAMNDIPKDKQKPDPYGMRLAMKRLKVEKAVYFGDVVDDMIMAKKAEVKPIGVIPPNADLSLKKFLLKAGASAILTDINQLEGVLDEKEKTKA